MTSTTKLSSEPVRAAEDPKSETPLISNPSKASAKWYPLYLSGAAVHQKPDRKAKMVRRIAFGEEFEGKLMTSDTKQGEEWIKISEEEYARLRGGGATYAEQTEKLANVDQYVVVGPNGKARAYPAPLDAEGERKMAGLPLPLEWTLLVLERKGDWIRHQIGWSDVSGGKKSSGLEIRAKKLPIPGSKRKELYPPPLLPTEIRPEDNKNEANARQAPTGPPLPPKRNHIVHGYEFLEVNPKKVDDAVDVKKLKKSHKKALLGILTCLLRPYGGDEKEAKWCKGYLAVLATMFGASEEEVEGLLPLLNTDVDPEPFLCSLPVHLGGTDSDGKAKKEEKEGTKADLSVERVRLPLTLLHHSLQCMGYYDARIRQLLRSLCTILSIPHDLFSRYEDIYCEALRVTVQAAEEAKTKHKQNWKWRWAKIGAVAVIGGVATAFTAGLAAPLVGGALVAVGGTSAVAATGAFIATSGGAIFFGGLVGTYATRMIGYKVDKRIADVEEFEFKPVTEKARPDSKKGSMSAVLGISGWHLNKDKATEELEQTWNQRFAKYFAPGKEVYALQWETEALTNFGNAISDLVKSKIKGYAISKGIALTSLKAVATALALPMLIMDFADVIDNSYSVAISRTDKAAMILADAIKSRVQGNRPLTIVAYSLGARMVFRALEILAEERFGKKSDADEKDKKVATGSADGPKVQAPEPPKKDDKKKKKKEKEPHFYDSGKNDADGMLMDVILMGTPVNCDLERWKKVRRVVGGRLVNVYSSVDWVLRFLVRSSELSYSLAGIQAIDGVKGLENLDVSSSVSDHFAYDKEIIPVLEQLRFYP